MSRRARYRVGSVLVPLLLSGFVPQIAAAQVRFNLPAESLARALRELASQANLNVYFDPSVVAGLKARAFQADLTPGAALARLLTGTGLVAVYVDGETVRIVPKAEVGKLHPKSGAWAHPGSDDPPGTGPAAADGGMMGAGNQSEQARQPVGQALQEVVITGSRLPTRSKYGPQEVQVYDRERIEESGQNSLGDFLSTLPSVSVSSPELSTNFTSTVRLRGLPVGTTLVLLNGRRIEGSGTSNGEYFDLSSIPLAAIQSVEVDENGSSAVYGSDAIAGVVNILLKKDYHGIAASARYGWAKNIRTVQTSLAFGKQWRRGAFSVIGSYETDGGLLNFDRRLSASNDYTAYGGPDNNYAECFPGNVFSLTGAPLPGAPAGSAATYAAVSGSATGGMPTLGQFNYGQLNTCSFFSGTSLLPDRRRGSVLMQGHLAVTSQMRLFTEVLYSHLTREAGQGYGGFFGEPGFQEFSVPADNPYNPFGVPLGLAVEMPGVPITEDIATDFFRPLIGIKGSIRHRWQWELTAWQSVDWSSGVYANEFPNAAAIQSALDSTDPATALNPFVAGPMGSPSELQSLFVDETYKEMGRDRSAEAFIRGPLYGLPAGHVQAIIGADYVRSTLYARTNIGAAADVGGNALDDYQRRYSAVFAEMRVPLIAHHERSGSYDVLSLTVSGRHDQYSDFGGANTYQAGFELRPMQQLLVRGTYGTAFAAPSLNDLYSPQSIGEVLLQNPATGMPELVKTKYGGNPSLDPLRGRSHAIGVIYSSRSISGLRAEITQWSVRENNVIQTLSPQVIIDNASAFPAQIVSNAVGQVVLLEDTNVNFGSIDVAGFDYRLAYQHRFAGGVASIDLSATETYRYRQALLPGGPAVESVSQAEDDANWAPRWKGIAAIGWKNGTVTAYLDGRYTGRYTDYDSAGVNGNFWIVDANLHWSIGRWLGERERLLRNGYIEGGATNLFNRAPQFSNYAGDFYGYDAAQASIVGRSLYIDIGWQW